MPAMTDPATEPLGRLSAALGTAPPPSVTELDPAVVDDLARMVQAARDEQAAAMARAVDDALRLVPRPLRGVVKRVILP